LKQNYYLTMRNLFVVFLAVLLCACASTHISSATKNASDIAKIPLNDLNIANAPIPEVLVAAQKAPYMKPPDTTCPSLSSQVRALDAVLGPDLDAAVPQKKSGFWELEDYSVNEVVTSGLRGTVEEILPLRDLVRTLSGAERYSAQLATAVAAGTARRAFLKGMASARACDK
jgi:hypothetical protein